MTVLATLACLAFGSACTAEPGGGFATVTGAALEIGFAAGADAFRTDLGYDATVRRLALTVHAIELSRAEGEGGTDAPTFDPANPPPGYSGCHGGHCHHESGALVAYEDIAAESSGRGVRHVRVLSMPVEREIDALAGEVVVLDRFEPHRELPRATLARLSITVERVALEATVGGGALEDADLPVTLDLPAELPLSAPLNIVVDRDGPSEVAFSAEIVIEQDLFDGLDFAELATGGAIEAGEGSALAEAVLTALARQVPFVHIEGAGEEHADDHDHHE